MSALERMLLSELESSARLRAQVVALTERLALAHQLAEGLQTELRRVTALLEEATAELPDGLTRSERAARDAFLDAVEAAS